MREKRTRAPRRLDAVALWDYAVKALASRACSSGELRQKLIARAATKDDVEASMSRLKDYGYLDDRRFADSFAVARLENQRMGKARVLQDLRRRRVAPVVAEASVQKAYQDVDESSLIEDFIRRKYRAVPKGALFREEKDLASAYRRLLRAGFQSGNAIRVLKRFAANPDLLDDFEPPAESEGE
jgi:regulatory protein